MLLASSTWGVVNPIPHLIVAFRNFGGTVLVTRDETTGPERRHHRLGPTRHPSRLVAVDLVPVYVVPPTSVLRSTVVDYCGPSNGDRL
jgi:hypothetical protein